MRVAWGAFCAVLLLATGGCALFTQPDRFGAAPVSYAALKGWEEDSHAEALETFLRSCTLLERKARQTSEGSGLAVDESQWRDLCTDARRIQPGNHARAREFFETRFTPFRVNNNGREQGLFTGYYEPLLYGSRTRKGDFIYPVYGPPPELPDKTPFYTHEQINKGAIRNRKLEIAWVDDPVMLFFMQIQGSGRIRLENGRDMLVGYAGKNGHPYVSLGKIMIEEKLLPRDSVNFFTIRQWLYDNRDRAISLMERNPSYVFFRKLDTKGPVGAAGAVLTAGRSLAVDSRYIPYGLPLYLETELPPMRDGVVHPFNRVMIAQDTGGAIRGPVRGDIFFGFGETAEYMAGYMKSRGVYTLLVPNEIAGMLQPEKENASLSLW